MGVPRGRQQPSDAEVADLATHSNSLAQQLLAPPGPDAPLPDVPPPGAPPQDVEVALASEPAPSPQPAPQSDGQLPAPLALVPPVADVDGSLDSEEGFGGHQVQQLDEQHESGEVDLVEQVDARQAFFAAMAADGGRLVNNVPSSGMGKFDAHYDPIGGRLTITVKIHFRFDENWADEAGKEAFKETFVREVQESWGGQYSFSCTKDGFEDLHVTPAIIVDPAAAADDCHYDVTVGGGEGRAMVGRQGSVEGQTSLGFFYAGDVERKGHKGRSIHCSMAIHERTRMERILEFFGGATSVQFAEASAAIVDEGDLAAIARALTEAAIPGAPPVPLVATGYARKGEKFFASSSIALEQRRAEAAAQFLRERTGREVIAQSHAEVAKPRLKRAKNDVKEQRAKVKNASGPIQRRGREHTLDEMQQELAAAETYAHTTREDTYRKVEISVDHAFEQTFTEDAYSVAVHEFGHMLGNPDEYFFYGARTLDRRIAQLLAAGDAASVDEATRLQTRRDQRDITLLGDSDAERDDIQHDWAMLIESAGIEIPEFGSQNSSLMSAGTSLLPRHYVTIFEALGRITSPSIRPSDWKFD